LDIDDRLGAAKLEGQALVVAQQLGVFGVVPPDVV
jgi:hypothetical protein